MDQVILVSDDSDPEDVIITGVKIRRKSTTQHFVTGPQQSSTSNVTESDEDIVIVSTVKPSSAILITPEKSDPNESTQEGDSMFLPSIPVTQIESEKIDNDLPLSDELPDLRSVCDDVWNGSNICQAAGSTTASYNGDSHPISVEEKLQKPASVRCDVDRQNSTVDTSDLSLFFSEKDTNTESYNNAKSGASTPSGSSSVFQNFSINRILQGQQLENNTDKSASVQNSLQADDEGTHSGNVSAKSVVNITSSPEEKDTTKLVSNGVTSTNTETSQTSPINMPDIFCIKNPKTPQENCLEDESDLPVLSFGALGKSNEEGQNSGSAKNVSVSNKVWEILDSSDKNDKDGEKSSRKRDKGKRLKLKFGTSLQQPTSKHESDQSDDEQRAPSFGRCLKNAREIKVDEGASTSGLHRSPSPVDIYLPNSRSPVAMVKPLLIRRLSSSDSLGEDQSKAQNSDYMYQVAKHEQKRHKKHKREKRLAELRQNLKAKRRFSDCDDKVFAVKDFDLVMSQLNSGTTVVPKIKLGVTSTVSSLSGQKKDKSGFVCNPTNCNPPNGTQTVRKSWMTSDPLNNPSPMALTSPASAPAMSVFSDQSLPWLTSSVQDSSKDQTDPFNNTTSSTASLDTPLSHTLSNTASTTPKPEEGTFRKLKLKLDLLNAHSTPVNPKKQKLSDDSSRPSSKSFTESFYSEDVCYYCGMSKPKAELSSCTKSHVCCGKCLEEHTKALLLGKNPKPLSYISGEKTSEGDVQKCCKLLSTLINVCKEQHQKAQVLEATQKLIDGTVVIDSYIGTLRYQHINGTLSSFSTLTYFLKKSLPMLRCKLLYGSLQLDDIRPPPMKVVDTSLVSQIEDASQDADPRSTWSLQCRYPNCNSYFPMSELRKTLPSMVVDMLEEKLDRSFLDFMSDELMKEVDGNPTVVDVENSTLSSSENTGSNEQEEVASEPTKRSSDFPENWSQMDEEKEYEVVPLDEDSEEYVVQAAMFHDTMFFPRNEIVSIKRVQNPILWKYYQLRKAKMERDIDMDDPERKLFHGTRKEVVEAICRDNFDCRLSGKHGHAYGQGTYFARDASYSHGYCLDWNTPYRGKLNLPGRLQHRRLISHLKQIRSHTGLAAGLGPPLNLSAQSSIPAIPATPVTLLQFPKISSTQPPPAHQQPVSSLTTTPGGLSYGYLRSLGSTGLPSQQQHILNSLILQQTGAATNIPQPANFGGLSAFGNPPSDGSNLGEQQAYTYHTMFIAKVLVGQYTRGSAVMKRPPPIDPNNEYGKLYDACVDCVLNPSIFVVFESQQLYPEYILEYRNRRDVT